MKNKKMFIQLALFSSIFLFAGCEKKPSQSADSSQTRESQTQEKQTKESEETQETSASSSIQEQAEKIIDIGEETGAEDEYQVLLTNQTGQKIKEIRIRDMQEEKFNKNLLQEGTVFSSEEKGRLYFAPSSLKTDASEEAQMGDKLVNTGYDIELSFDDGSSSVLHGFPFEEAAEAELHYQEGVAYVVYRSVSTGEEVTTQETEKMNQEISEGE